MINKNYKDYWKLLAARKENTARNTVQYCLLKALTAKSNKKVEIALALLKRAFTPVTNTTELANGRKPYDTLNNYIRHAAWTTPTMIFGLDISLYMDEDGIKEYTDLLKSIRSVNIDASEPDYMYIAVRQDISKEQQIVQACHAAFVAGQKFNHDKPDNVHFALIGAKDEEELKTFCQVVEQHGTEYVSFVEPDLDNSLTAIATQPIRGYSRGRLRQLPLLKLD